MDKEHTLYDILNKINSKFIMLNKFNITLLNKNYNEKHYLIQYNSKILTIKAELSDLIINNKTSDEIEEKFSYFNKIVLEHNNKILSLNKNNELANHLNELHDNLNNTLKFIDNNFNDKFNEDYNSVKSYDINTNIINDTKYINDLMND